MSVFLNFMICSHFRKLFDRPEKENAFFCLNVQKFYFYGEISIARWRSDLKTYMKISVNQSKRGKVVVHSLYPQCIHRAMNNVLHYILNKHITILYRRVSIITTQLGIMVLISYSTQKGRYTQIMWKNGSSQFGQLSMQCSIVMT